MATANLTLTGDWVKAVDAGDEFVISIVSGGSVEVAISDTETAPSVSGHALDISTNQGAGVVAVTAWTP